MGINIKYPFTLQISSPACTELETVMMDWLAELIGLPEHFTFKANQGGGGVIQVMYLYVIICRCKQTTMPFFKNCNISKLNILVYLILI